jgi:hypothetical protein
MEARAPRLLRWLGPRFSEGEKLALLATFLLAHLYLLICLPTPIIYDQSGYYQGAQGIVAHGLFSNFPYSEFRAYGYPFFVALLMHVAGWFGIPIRVFAGEVQLGLYVLSCLTLRAALARSGVPVRMVQVAFIAAVVNPFALICPAYLLSEGLSVPLTLMLLAAVIWLASAAPADYATRGIAIAGLLCGSVEMVRPSNLYLILLLATGIALGGIRLKARPVRWVYYSAIGATFLVLPWIPELVNNITYRQQATIFPTYVSDSPEAQILSIRLAKYGTSFIEGQDPHVFYNNPFYHDEPLDAVRPFRWYWQHPVRGAATMGIHVFDVLDQDLPFTYITNLTPWYYPWLAFANLFVLAVACIGLAGCGWYIRKSQPQARLAYLVLGAILLLHLGIQAPFHAEVRFGIPSLIVLYIWAAWGAVWRFPALARRGKLIAVGTVVVLTVSGGALSEWVHHQAPVLVHAQKPPVAPPPPPEGSIHPIADGKAFVSGELKNWAFYHAGANDTGAAVLPPVEPPKEPVSMIYHPLGLKRSTEYIVDFDARVASPQGNHLQVGLYGGPKYDHADQNTVFQDLSPAMRHYTTSWDSGPDAPADASLRFISYGPQTVEIRNVKLRVLQK